MKTNFHRAKPKRSRDRGTALIVVIGIIAVLLIWSVGNVRTLDHLGRELRMLDQVQRRAWNQVQVPLQRVETRAPER